MSGAGNIWLPSPRRAPLELGELTHAVPGPDARYQEHRQGCGCGDMDCPWYRGERARLEYENASASQRVQWAQDVLEPMMAPAPAP